MFTRCFSAVCLCYGQDDSSDHERVTPDSLRPLLDRNSPSLAMPRPRTYGKKKTGGTVAASAIFGTASSQLRLPSSPRRAPLEDLTARVSNLNIRTEEYEEQSERSSSSEDEDQKLRRIRLAGKQQREESTITDDALDKSSSSEDSHDSDNIPLANSNYTPETLALLPLLQKYHVDCKRKLQVEKWEVVLPAGCKVVKIAEASYAEVYRVTIDGRDSILKIMQLKVPFDAASSRCETAIEVNQVVSEVRLMNALTEYSGFVHFKDAHLIRGQPCASLIKAYNNCTRWDPQAGLSNFPKPHTFTNDSTFLAIELGDAGEVLEEVKLESIDQVWDILLGVVVALAAAETIFEFEHRDLHENNICILRHEPTAVDFSKSSCRYGRSGFEVIILDYGLSRAKLPNGDVVYNDLENDLAIFQGTAGHSQYDIYRRMRTHLFQKDRSMFPRDWHVESSKDPNNGATWADFTPYSNVLWIKYLLGYLKKAFKECGGDAKELARFNGETKELSKLLNPRTLVANGAFATASEVWEFVCDHGWLTEEQIAGLAEGASLLNESNQAGEGENAQDEDE